MTSDSKIGPYTVLSRLGRGGMGEVFLARDPRLEREVALKTLSSEFAGDPARMARFRREALSLAANNHPNIATIYGFEEPTPGQLVLVMEHVPGETLSSRLRRGGLARTEALRICLQIAEAVEAAHRRGVIHRDLKPGNVMVGPAGLVKVLDFGLAASLRDWTEPEDPGIQQHEPVKEAPSDRDPRVRESAVESDARTVSIGDARTVSIGGHGDRSGTPGYMSPEQARGEPQDERTDVFSFGCVLFECLSGVRAFVGKTEADVMSAVLDRDPPWEALPQETPHAVRDLTMRCLERNPAARPPTMREIRLALEEELGIRRAAALLAGEAEITTPHNLPSLTTTFVGRENAMRECRELLATTRLLTLTGVGGGGKTRLALRVAEQVLAQYPDGVWFVDLAPVVDPDHVAASIAAAMGVQEAPGMAILDTLEQTVARKRLLLLLDNCEHLIPASVACASALIGASPELRVLATSREPLGVHGEHVFSVPPLAVPRSSSATSGSSPEASEAVQLFLDRARAVAPDFVPSAQNLEAVAELCRRLDGIPLAIELAAARVRMLSPAQIADRLQDRFRLLARSRKTGSPRHQTLLATLQWSHDLLREDEQTMLRALSVFAGGWTLDAAVAVCGHGRDEFEVLDLLTSLEDRSLLVATRSADADPRYHFLETVREYARGLAAERSETPHLRRSHRDWFLALAESFAEGMQGNEQAAWLRRLDPERDNLRVALESFMADDAEAAAALQMTVSLQWYWLFRGHLIEGSEALESAIALTRSLGPDPVLANALHGLGNMRFRQDDYEEAREWYEQSLAMREVLGDRRGLAGTLGALGNVAQYQGRYEAARDLFSRSLQINRELGNRLWEATNLTCLGNCARASGDRTEAGVYLRQAVEINRQIENAIGEATALEGLGSLLLECSDPAGARAALEDALPIARRLGHVHDEASILANLARVARAEADPDRARSGLAEAIAILMPLGEMHLIATCLEDLAALAQEAGHTARAVRIWSAAEALRESVGAPGGVTERESRARYIADARTRLSSDEFEAARARGLGMSVEDAVGEALGVDS